MAVISCTLIDIFCPTRPISYVIIIIVSRLGFKTQQFKTKTKTQVLKTKTKTLTGKTKTKTQMLKTKTKAKAKSNMTQQ